VPRVVTECCQKATLHKPGSRVDDSPPAAKAASRAERSPKSPIFFPSNTLLPRAYGPELSGYVSIGTVGGCTDLRMAMHVTRLATLSELACIRGLWNQLAAGMPLRSWEWLESWWRYYGGEADQRQRTRELFTLAVFTSEGQLFGLAPWYLERVAGLGRVVRFLGSGEVCTDYTTILCEPGHENQVARAIFDWLLESPSLCDWLTHNEQRPWDVLELTGVDENDIVLNLLARYLGELGHLVYQRPTVNCWRLDLPPTWEDYLQTLSKSHRKQVRRCQRKYLETGRARLCTARDEVGLERGLDILATLHDRRRRELGERGAFSSRKFFDFHDEVAARLLPLGALGLHWLELDGEPVAAEYHLAGSDTVFAYQSGIDPSALEDEPGRLITIATIQRAIADGKKHFDFLRGDEPYKAHWRAVPHKMCDLHIMPSTHRARLRHSLWVASDSVKGWLKSGFGLSSR
jgi:CelD/BcsL family acetyltransferase involved in cellulose biosynthesis